MFLLQGFKITVRGMVAQTFADEISRIWAMARGMPSGRWIVRV